MPILKEIGNDLNKKPRRKAGRKSMLILSDSEEEDDYDTALQIMESNKGAKFRKKQSLCLDEEDDDDEESDGYLSPLDKDKENVKPKQDGKFSKRKQHPDSVKKTTSGVKDVKLDTKTPNPKPKKVRRRSSARFLRLSGRFNDEDDEGMDETPEEEQREKLNEMYSKAIQLNAANKINAVNSWGLNIIDKMDKFLGDDEDDNGTSPNVVQNLPVDDAADSAVKEKRVNFTKASCTIDACVKIYSYRVDDAHLTSYKVLANLNRTDGGKDVEKSGLRTNDESLSDSEERNSLQRTTNQKRLDRNTEAKTIESNIANLNISKLDSAYDIDPIFHKMSQKFDEGGAKGLLLVNLGVANDGCRIVLDSKEERDAVSSMEPELINETNDEVEPGKEGMLDISNLSKILESKLNDRAIESIELVPQLSELRQMYAVLEEEGYVEASKKFKSRRYANNAEEDKAAEKAIHREALERSTASGIQQKTSFLLPNSSVIGTNLSLMGTFTSTSQSNSNNYDGDHYADCHDDWDDGDDGDFENFVAMDDHAEKYSSESFRYDSTPDDLEAKNSVEPTANASKAYATTFLDEICEGDALIHRNQFNYFNPKMIEKFTSGNKWAGAAHWKKSETSIRPKKANNSEVVEEKKKRKDSKRKKTKDTKEKCLIDFNVSSTHSCLQDLLKKSKKVRGKTVKTDPTQFAKATKQKYDKEDNLLPVDAEINLKHFTEFFVRPGATLLPATDNAIISPKKTVGFLGLDNNQFDDGVDDSYDDGPGFELAGDTMNVEDDIDNFAIGELEGVRKVEKIVVKHATVAKKVDVKRLKQDLWTELEVSTCPENPLPEQDKSDEEDVDVEDKKDEIEKVVSFKETVKKLSATEAQEDVSLPFYFICVLHLANEKGLKLENGEHGLSDFVISIDTGTPSN